MRVGSFLGVHSLPQHSFWLLLISIATTMESDSAEELVNILNSCRVPESLSAFVTRAYETTSDFAFAFRQPPQRFGRRHPQVHGGRASSLGPDKPTSLTAAKGSQAVSRPLDAASACLSLSRDTDTSTQPG